MPALSSLPAEAGRPDAAEAVLDVAVPDSRVDLLAPAVADLKGVVRVGRALATGALPVGHLRAQLDRAPLEPATPGVPVGLTASWSGSPPWVRRPR